MLHKNGFSSLQRALAKLNHAIGKHSYAFAFFFSSSLPFFFCCGFILCSLRFLDVMAVKITLKTEQNWCMNICLRCSVKSQLGGISCLIQNKFSPCWRCKSCSVKHAKQNKKSTNEYLGNQSRVTTHLVTQTGPRRKHFTQAEKWPHPSNPKWPHPQLPEEPKRRSSSSVLLQM